MNYAIALSGALIFLFVTISVSVWVAVVNKVPTEEIAAATIELTPQLMAIALLCLLVLAVFLSGSEHLKHAWQSHRPFALVVVVGISCGATLAFAYINFISPLHEQLVLRFGDYVPAGETTRVFRNSLVLFFIANVLLAPVAEEIIYRGYLISAFEAQFGLTTAVAVSAIAFGLLHWLGGAWYMLITAIFAGGMFVGLKLWSGGLTAPFLAHLTLNLIEFAWVATRAAGR